VRNELARAGPAGGGRPRAGRGRAAASAVGVPSGNSFSRASVGCKLAQIVRSLFVDGVWFVHLPSLARPSISGVTDRRCWRARLGAVRVSCTAKFSGQSTPIAVARPGGGCARGAQARLPRLRRGPTALGQPALDGRVERRSFGRDHVRTATRFASPTLPVLSPHQRSCARSYRLPSAAWRSRRLSSGRQASLEPLPTERGIGGGIVRKSSRTSQPRLNSHFCSRARSDVAPLMTCDSVTN
jgi:hypothetical protein